MPPYQKEILDMEWEVVYLIISFLLAIVLH